MGTDAPQNPSNDDLIKCYEKMEFPSGDIDDLIFGKVELGGSKINQEAPK